MPHEPVRDGVTKEIARRALAGRTRAIWVNFLAVSHKVIFASYRDEMQELGLSERTFADLAEEIYRRDGERMWRSILLFSGDYEVARDSVAEAFAQALRRGGSLHSPDRWIWRAAFKIASGEMHRSRRTPRLILEDSYELSTHNLELATALGRLTSHQRRAIILHHVGGYSLEETAKIIGSTRSAVSVHLVRGRKKLLRLLEE
jgi:RNA polymerase sigma factor (sigma-70 family)